MRAIHLTQGQHAIVDDAVYEWASKFAWCALRYRHTFYAVRNVRRLDGKRRTSRLHREILKAPHGVEVDHIDGNGLNNLLENLRPCSHAENIRNSRKSSNNTSGYVGVAFYRPRGDWRAQITVNRIVRHLGYFDTAIEAAHARDAAATKFHGEFAHLNFP